jgi:hypothetical protein
MGAVGGAFQGSSVALSGDGNTAIVGGYGDNNGVGAAWVWVAPPTPLTVTAISPNSGPPKGGTKVTITGAGFVNGATVTIDGVPATSVTWVSSTSLTAITPASNAGAGAKNVVVTNPDAQSGTLLNGFSYGNFFMWVSGISPNAGPLTGGTLVTITGVGFSSGATVTIGGTPATSVVRVNATTILANTPPANGLVAGAKNVVVTNNDNSTSALPGGFTYGTSTVNGHCGGAGIPCLPATPPSAGVRDLPTVLDLNAGDGPGMIRCLMDALGHNLPGTLTYQKQTTAGVSTIAWNNQWIAFYPVANDTAINLGDPLHHNPANTFDVATRCGTLVVAPAVFNLDELGAVFNTMGLFAQINQDGMIVVQSHGTTYVAQPDFVVTPGAPGTPRLEATQDGAYRFMDSGGNSQLLHLVSVAP